MAPKISSGQKLDKNSLICDVVKFACQFEIIESDIKFSLPTI